MSMQHSLFVQDVLPCSPVLSVDGWTGSAVFSLCNQYRYELHREWSDGDGSALVVMLNPSTADARENDPTVARVCRFMRDAGVRRFVVTNLFAFITPYPEAMVARAREQFDVVGPENDVTIAVHAERARLILVAWGACAAAPKLARQRARALCFDGGPLGRYELHALRVSQDGAPAHPLYLPGTLKPTGYPREQLRRWCMGGAR
jgi:hypothetical protein